ncbi:MAG: radical SAM protein [Polyangiaceae bacterium]|nr:radical SAM protein [Polyangiaceae bacterium]
MKTSSYGTFSQGAITTAAQAHVPLSATIEVTRRCPLTCEHCYNNLPMGDQQAKNTELTTEQYFGLLDEIADAGTLWLLFTGGEIFARKDFLDIYRYAKGKGFLITLFTNGILIDEEIADVLAEYRPFSIEITLYGYTRESYEALTRKPGSHARCVKAVHLLLERKLPLKLKTVAVTRNRHEIQLMRKWAEELGVPFKFDALINPRIDCSSSPLAVRIQPEQVVEMDLADSARVAAWRDYFARSTAETEDPEKLYHCGAGVRSFAVDPYGNLEMCVLSTKETLLLESGKFKEGWTSFLRAKRERKHTRETKCTKCGLKNICGMCPANGELESGDAEEPVAFLCEVAHLRAHAIGHPVRAHGPCEYCPGGAEHENLLAKVEKLGGAQPLKLAACTPVTQPRAPRPLPVVQRT